MTTESERQCWTLDDLRAGLSRYEDELRAAGLRRNTINTYVQHPERFISWLAREYAPRGPIDRLGSQATGVRSKYAPLSHWLASSVGDSVRLTFAQVEAILGFPLPVSARRHRAWWANERSGNHSHATSWLGAGFSTVDVDLQNEVVGFTR